MIEEISIFDTFLSVAATVAAQTAMPYARQTVVPFAEDYMKLFHYFKPYLEPQIQQTLGALEIGLGVGTYSDEHIREVVDDVVNIMVHRADGWR